MAAARPVDTMHDTMCLVRCAHAVSSGYGSLLCKYELLPDTQRCLCTSAHEADVSTLSCWRCGDCNLPAAGVHGECQGIIDNDLTVCTSHFNNQQRIVVRDGIEGLFDIRCRPHCDCRQPVRYLKTTAQCDETTQSSDYMETSGSSSALR